MSDTPLDTLSYLSSIALTSGLIAGVAVSYLNAHHANRRAELETKRKKIEELFVLVDSYSTSLYGYYSKKDEMYKSTTEVDIYKSEEAIKERIKNQFTIQMLISLYFPKADSYWMHLNITRSKLANLHGTFLLNPILETSTKSPLASDFNDTLNKFDEERIVFLNFLTKHASKEGIKF